MADAQNTVKIIFKGEGNLLKQVKALDKATKSLINAQAKLVQQGKLIKSDAQKNASALKRIEIQLEALNLDYKKVGISTKLWNSALKGSAVDLQRVRNQLKKYNAEQKNTNVSTRILGGSFAVLRSKLLIFNFAMALGIRQLIEFVKESTKVKSMETAFNTLSGSVELSSVSLQKLKDATGDTMSEFELFQQANNAMILGVSKNSNEMAEMFKIAKTLGRALGRDTASSVESLITGIGRQSRLMLDNIGIIVKSEEAYKSYADELGTTVDELSDAQKKQAFLTATMESARQKVTTIGTSTIPTAQDSFEKFSTATSNLSRAIGESLSPMMSDLASSSTGVLKNFTELLDLTRQNTGAEMQFAKAQDLAERDIKRYGESLGVTFDKSRSLLSQLKAMFAVLQSKRDNGKAFVTIKQRIEELEKAQLRYNAVTADEKASQARRDELSAIEKAQEAIRKKQEAEQKAFNKKVENQAKINFQEEMAQKRAEQRNETEKANHKAMLEAKENQDDAYFNGLKMSTKSAYDELKEMLKDLENSNTAYFTGFTMAQNSASQELKKMQDEMQEQNQDFLSNISNSLSAFNGVMSAWKTHMKSRLDEELSTLKDSEVYREADTEKRKDLEREVTKGYEKEQTAQFRIGQATALADIAMSTSSAVMKSVAGSWVTLGQPWFGLITALGTIQAGLVLSQKPPSFESGGMVGGQRHSQGGTMIEAEQGEFVMSRNAVQAIGVETLNQMNQGGTSGITLNISAPLVDETIVDTIIPAIQKAQRMNLA